MLPCTRRAAMGRLLLAGALLCLARQPSALAQTPPVQPPYPRSGVVDRITWDWSTLRTAAPGSDLWPVTWAKDDAIVTAWGDGGGFGGTDHDGRVALGFARIDGPPEQLIASNLNGGKNARHQASFPKKGKVGGILAVGDRVYGWLNTQNRPWPDVDQALIWSDDGGLTWKKSDWVFPSGNGNLKPSTFLNFGKRLAGVPANCGRYVYFYGQRQGNASETFIGRAPVDQLQNRQAYKFVTELVNEQPVWSVDAGKAMPVFTDRRPNGDLASVVYIPALKRYLLSSFHKGPGELGLFDAPAPWGPWTTVAYEEHWGRMGHAGQGLTCSFPAKWISPDGRTLWCVFSAYGDGAKQGINAHDKFNLVRATIKLKH
ncbi:MAG TPA: DUF4185 domain-containing protein [Tepidisphaeraceae bacterium]|nr:DUF4185 domain-containing protein [Tepidisphaeraceae bacterium]